MYQLCDSCKVLSSCAVFHGIVILVNINNVLNVKLFKIEANLRSISTVYFDDNWSQVGKLISVPYKDIDEEFITTWFSEDIVQCASKDVVFIYTSCGLIYYWAVGSQSPEKAFYMYTASLPVLDLFWSKDNELQLVLQNGVIINLDEDGEKNWYLPLTNVTGALILEKTAMVTDFTDCCRVELNKNSEAILLPHKGIMTFCPLPGFPTIVMASTYHRSIYVINFNFKTPLKTPGFSMPLKSDLNLLLNKLDQLSEVNKEIEKQDKFLETLSLTMRKTYLLSHFSLSLNIVQILGTAHVVLVKASLDLEEIIFGSDMWNVSLTIFKKDTNYTFLHGLSKDFDRKNPLKELIKVEFPNYDGDLKVTCRLICVTKSTGYWLIIPLGEVILDASYFLQPISMAAINDDPYATEFLLERVLEGVTYHNKIRSCKLPLSGNAASDTIFLKLLANSKGLWRVSEWNEIGKMKQIKILFFGNPVTLSISENNLDITSNSFETCCFIKVCAIRRLVDRDATVDYETLVEIMNLQHSLELLHFEGADREQLLKIYHRLRNKISSKLTV